MRETPIGIGSVGRMGRAGRASERTARFSSTHGDAPNPSWAGSAAPRAAHLLVAPAIRAAQAVRMRDVSCSVPRLQARFPRSCWHSASVR
jgi:hypothetical protein